MSSTLSVCMYRSTSRRSAGLGLPPLFSMSSLFPNDSKAQFISPCSSSLRMALNPIDVYQSTAVLTSGTCIMGTTFSGMVYSLIVIFQPQVSNQRLALQVAQRVLELHELDEQIVLRVESGRCHGGFQVETQPLLDAQPFELFTALGQVEEQHQVEHDGRG